MRPICCACGIGLALAAFVGPAPALTQDSVVRLFSAEDKIRIMIAGLRGEDGIAELCHREGIAQSLYYPLSRMAHAMIIAACAHLVFVGGIAPTIETLVGVTDRIQHGEYPSLSARQGLLKSRILLSSSFLRHCDEAKILLYSIPQLCLIGVDGEQLL